MDEAKRKQFIARLSRALGRDQEMCPASNINTLEMMPVSQSFAGLSVHRAG